METDLHALDGRAPDRLSRLALCLRRPLLDGAVLAVALALWAALVAVIARAFSDGVPELTSSALKVAAWLVGLAASSGVAHLGARLILAGPTSAPTEPAGARTLAPRTASALSEPQPELVPPLAR